MLFNKCDGRVAKEKQMDGRKLQCTYRKMQRKEAT